MRWLRYLILLPVVAVLNCTVPQPVVPSTPFLYDSIVFDIAYVDSLAEPRRASLDLFRHVMDEQRLCGRQNVTFTVRRGSSLSETLIWNVDMLQTYQMLNRGRPSSSSDISDMAVFVSYVHGTFLPPSTPGRTVCGYTYGAASYSALVDHYDRGNQETALLLHELGHVMNLPGGDHCESTKCVMYEFVRNDDARFCASCLERIDLLRQSR